MTTPEETFLAELNALNVRVTPAAVEALIENEYETVQDLIDFPPTAAQLDSFGVKGRSAIALSNHFSPKEAAATAPVAAPFAGSLQDKMALLKDKSALAAMPFDQIITLFDGGMRELVENFDPDNPGSIYGIALSAFSKKFNTPAVWFNEDGELAVEVTINQNSQVIAGRPAKREGEWLTTGNRDYEGRFVGEAAEQEYPVDPVSGEILWDETNGEGGISWKGVSLKVQQFVRIGFKLREMRINEIKPLIKSGVKIDALRSALYLPNTIAEYRRLDSRGELPKMKTTKQDSRRTNDDELSEAELQQLLNDNFSNRGTSNGGQPWDASDFFSDRDKIGGGNASSGPEIDTIALRNSIIKVFNESEVKDLCFGLKIDYENLPGSGKSNKVRELIAYGERHSMLPNILAAAQRLRPLTSFQ